MSARAYPATDGQGNPLNHAELCAWRFGGNCDCAAGTASVSDRASSALFAEARKPKPSSGVAGDD